MRRHPACRQATFFDERLAVPQDRDAIAGQRQLDDVGVLGIQPADRPPSFTSASPSFLRTAMRLPDSATCMTSVCSVIQPADRSPSFTSASPLALRTAMRLPDSATWVTSVCSGSSLSTVPLFDERLAVRRQDRDAIAGQRHLDGLGVLRDPACRQAALFDERLAVGSQDGDTIAGQRHLGDVGVLGDPACRQATLFHQRLAVGPQDGDAIAGQRHLDDVGVLGDPACRQATLFDERLAVGPQDGDSSDYPRAGSILGQTWTPVVEFSVSEGLSRKLRHDSRQHELPWIGDALESAAELDRQSDNEWPVHGDRLELPCIGVVGRGQHFPRLAVALDVGL